MTTYSCLYHVYHFIAQYPIPSALYTMRIWLVSASAMRLHRVHRHTRLTLISCSVIIANSLITSRCAWNQFLTIIVGASLSPSSLALGGFRIASTAAGGEHPEESSTERERNCCPCEAQEFGAQTALDIICLCRRLDGAYHDRSLHGSEDGSRDESRCCDCADDRCAA